MRRWHYSGDSKDLTGAPTAIADNVCACNHAAIASTVSSSRKVRCISRKWYQGE
ncbi:hypothetical protein NBG4_1040005 [Candidatus Sulfobium mesophilum]|uniref:Uncharacterized protein n=1 Tax=Candidatus Sulfobium mesophilum TaxID=2016548 RepID=A0A2U3QE89_9BACT|nr:hypothetical protein NBG4_1040005 [Candidatus Sulfobium mesophilum]